MNLFKKKVTRRIHFDRCQLSLIKVRVQFSDDRKELLGVGATTKEATKPVLHKKIIDNQFGIDERIEHFT